MTPSGSRLASASSSLSLWHSFSVSFSAVTALCIAAFACTCTRLFAAVFAFSAFCAASMARSNSLFCTYSSFSSVRSLVLVSSVVDALFDETPLLCPPNAFIQSFPPLLCVAKTSGVTPFARTSRASSVVVASSSSSSSSSWSPRRRVVGSSNTIIPLFCRRLPAGGGASSSSSSSSNIASPFRAHFCCVLLFEREESFAS